MSFPAYWPGVCQDCGQRYPEGTPIAMLPGVGWGHAEACPEDAEPPTGAVCPKCFLTRSLSGECGCDE